MPLVSDSVKSANYLSGSIYTGLANSRVRDVNSGLFGSFYRTNRFDKVQIFYGASLNIGAYRVGRFFPSNIITYNPDPNFDSLINARGGRKSYGSYGVFGGINFVDSYKDGSEWRMLGLEMSANKEFGQYASYRKNLPDSISNVLDRKQDFYTLALTTEYIGRSGTDGAAGVKLALGSKLSPVDFYYNGTYNQSKVLPMFMSMALHYTQRKTTGYGQFVIGYHTLSLHFGMNFRL